GPHDRRTHLRPGHRHGRDDRDRDPGVLHRRHAADGAASRSPGSTSPARSGSSGRSDGGPSARPEEWSGTVAWSVTTCGDARSPHRALRSGRPPAPAADHRNEEPDM
ncbi:MAG: hypothetical protein AVDCRST_MAG66-3763, partial [uncultured Pseudonocardia sp.]